MTETITLDDDAYERLKRRKSPDESFSQVIRRLTEEQSWREVVGILADEEATDLLDSIESGRQRSRRIDLHSE